VAASRHAALAAEQPEHARQAADRLLALTPNDIAAVALRDAAAALPTPSGNRRGRPRALTRRRCTAAKRMVDAGKLDDAAIVLAAAAWLDEDAAMRRTISPMSPTCRGGSRTRSRISRAVELAPRRLFRRNLEALEAALTPTPEADAGRGRRRRCQRLAGERGWRRPCAGACQQPPTRGR
jgi:hypothetical protein